MTILKKNSRLITVDSIDYRWIVGPNDGFSIFIAEKEGVKGRRMEVYISTDINKFWIEFPNVQDLNLRLIKPKDAELIIRQALKQGWNPDEKGQPIVFDLIEQKLIRRNASR